MYGMFQKALELLGLGRYPCPFYVTIMSCINEILTGDMGTGNHQQMGRAIAYHLGLGNDTEPRLGAHK